MLRFLSLTLTVALLAACSGPLDKEGVAASDLTHAKVLDLKSNAPLAFAPDGVHALYENSAGKLVVLDLATDTKHVVSDSVGGGYGVSPDGGYFHYFSNQQLHVRSWNLAVDRTTPAPASTVGYTVHYPRDGKVVITTGVTIAWSSDDPTYTYADVTLNVGRLSLADGSVGAASALVAQRWRPTTANPSHRVETLFDPSGHHVIVSVYQAENLHQKSFELALAGPVALASHATVYAVAPGTYDGTTYLRVDGTGKIVERVAATGAETAFAEGPLYPHVGVTGGPALLVDPTGTTLYYVERLASGGSRFVRRDRDGSGEQELWTMPDALAEGPLTLTNDGKYLVFDAQHDSGYRSAVCGTQWFGRTYRLLTDGSAPAELLQDKLPYGTAGVPCPDNDYQWGAAPRVSADGRIAQLVDDHPFVESPARGIYTFVPSAPPAFLSLPSLPGTPGDGIPRQEEPALTWSGDGSTLYFAWNHWSIPQPPGAPEAIVYEIRNNTLKEVLRKPGQVVGVRPIPKSASVAVVLSGGSIEVVRP